MAGADGVPEAAELMLAVDMNGLKRSVVAVAAIGAAGAIAAAVPLPR
jgi:hypothetical protein